MESVTDNVGNSGFQSGPRSRDHLRDVTVRKRIRLGISSCLLGKPVRYDGGQKLDRFLSDTLGQFVEYIAVCPEYECGLGVPREPMRLLGNRASPHLITRYTGR